TFYPLSDDPSTRYHRITNADFRPSSSRRSRCQAPFCVCAHRAITDRTEGTIARLRYNFGGDRPSQTTRQPRSAPFERPREIVNKTRVVFHCWLPQGQNPGIVASHLCYASHADDQWQAIVKVHGVFLS